MTDQPDHAAAARQALVTLQDDQVLQRLGYPGFITANAALAQAHATLAVAEQLRIANLIAYKQLHTARRGHRNDRTDNWEVDSLPVGRDNITDEIDRVLDLEHLGEDAS